MSHSLFPTFTTPRTINLISNQLVQMVDSSSQVPLNSSWDTRCKRNNWIVFLPQAATGKSWRVFQGCTMEFPCYCCNPSVCWCKYGISQLKRIVDWNDTSRSSTDLSLSDESFQKVIFNDSKSSKSKIVWLNAF